MTSHVKNTSFYVAFFAKYMQTTAQPSFTRKYDVHVQSWTNYTYGTSMEWLLKHMGTLQILHMDYPFLPFPQFCILSMEPFWTIQCNLH